LSSALVGLVVGAGACIHSTFDIEFRIRYETILLYPSDAIHILYYSAIDVLFCWMYQYLLLEDQISDKRSKAEPVSNFGRSRFELRALKMMCNSGPTLVHSGYQYVG
jgi:hypothetical protein